MESISDNHTLLYDLRLRDWWGGDRIKSEMKRSVGRPPKSSAPALTATIVDAASKVFIADEAKVSPQTLYARFSDKTKLYEALMESRTSALLDAMAAPLQEDAPLQEALETFGVTLLSTFLNTDLQRLHQMVISEAKTFPALARTFFIVGPERGRELLIAYLRRSVSAGHVNIDQVEDAAEQFIGSLIGSLVIRATLAQPAKLLEQKEIVRWVRLGVDVFLRAYRPKS